LWENSILTRRLRRFKTGRVLEALILTNGFLMSRQPAVSLFDVELGERPDFEIAFVPRLRAPLVMSCLGRNTRSAAKGGNFGQAQKGQK